MTKKKTVQQKTKTTRSSNKQRKKLSSRAMVFIFIVVTAVAGTVAIQLSEASPKYQEVDPKASNEKAFSDLKANRKKKGKNIEKIQVSEPPADFGKTKETPVPEGLKKQYSSPPKSSYIPRALDLTPKVHADPWVRAAAVAQAQKYLGYQGYGFFGYGLFPNEEWCSDFVSLVMKDIGWRFYWGYNGWRVPLVDNVGSGMYDRGLLRDRSYRPLPGDLVFFDWPSDRIGWSDHIGIVESVDNKGSITTIEGNVGNSDNKYSSVQRKSYGWDDTRVIAFGRWLGN